MSKKLKTGFSLVEVMILFAVLAVAMAASLPMLSKKSSVPPRKTPHGVYICVANGERPRQEIYNSSNLLGAHNDGEACVFNVPRANEYKVELYSAGAGGVQVANITSTDAPEQVYTFDRNSARQYHGGGDTANPITSVLPSNMSYIPTNEEFRHVFDGMTVTLRTNSGHGGQGGDSRLWYPGVKGYRCVEHESDIEEMDIYKEAPDYKMYNNEVAKQYKEYCIAKNDGLTNGKKIADYASRRNIVYTSSPEKLVTEYGGSGGNSLDMALDYRIIGSESENALYTRFPYPFLAYFSDLVNNSAGHGYFAARCNGRNGIMGTECEAGAPENGKDAEDVSNRTQLTVKDGTYEKLRAEKGGDVTTFAAFRIPRFTGGNLTTGSPHYVFSDPQYVTIQNTRATGGNGGVTGYQYKFDGEEKKYEEGSKDFIKDYSYIAFYGELPPETPNPLMLIFDNADNGADTESLGFNVSDKSQSSDAGWTYYRVYSGPEVPESNIMPIAVLRSHLMQRNYRVGGPGGNGSHRTYRVTTLGSRCTMNVPNGGPVMTTDRYNDPEWQANAERGLEVSIECRDTEDHIVFQQSLNGATYDRTLTPSTYTWHRNLDAGNAGARNLAGMPHYANSADADNMQYVRPRWSRVFNNINTLNNLHVGQGGRGTSITDRCNVPRGTFNMQAYRRIGFNPEDDEPWNTPVDINHDGTMADGYQCYPEPFTTRTYQDLKEGNARNHYDITEPTAGGPAAVVITW